MLDLSEAISLDFRIPATDPLGREEVVGKIRFLPDTCELHWRLSANVFRGGKGEHQVIEVPYGEIERVELKKQWFRPVKISFHVNDPSLVKEIPSIVMGNLTFEIDKRSAKELKRLQNYIDFKQSLFIFDRTERYLDELKG